MPFKMIRNDITKVKADAIVNTANPKVAIGPGVDRAIYEAAGKERLLKARAKIGVLEPGEVGITPAFDLPAKYIIHSSGPQYKDGTQGEPELLRRCYDRALSLAYRKRCRSIAFPLMATGRYAFPEELGMQIAIDAFTAFLMDHEMEIMLVVFDSGALKVSGKLFEHVESFIDDDYVFEAILREAILCEDVREDSDDTVYLGAIFPEERRDCGKAGERPRLGEQRKAVSSLPEENARPMPMMAPMAAPVRRASRSLEDDLKSIYTETFSKHLRQMLNKKGLKNSEVYTAANISKQYFSKLLKGQVNPSKEKMLALAVGLRLNMDEAVDFLGLAGYAFSPISQTDRVVRYFIEEKEYSVMKIDIVLFDYGLPCLSGY